jgi:hypothetical protein
MVVFTERLGALSMGLVPEDSALNSSIQFNLELRIELNYA